MCHHAAFVPLLLGDLKMQVAKEPLCLPIVVWFTGAEGNVLALL